MSRKLVTISHPLHVPVHDVENRAEDGLGRGASHHEAVVVGQLDDFVGICLRDAASIDDAHDLGLLRANVGTHPPSDEVAGLLSQFWTCDRSRVRGPQGLVNQHDVCPVIDVGGLERFKLFSHNHFLLFGFTVLLGLTEAVKDAQVAVFGL